MLLTNAINTDNLALNSLSYIYTWIWKPTLIGNSFNSRYLVIEKIKNSLKLRLNQKLPYLVYKLIENPLLLTYTDTKSINTISWGEFVEVKLSNTEF